MASRAYLVRVCAFVGAAHAACAGGSETGNPSIPIEVALAVRSSEPTAVGVRTADASTVLDAAWVALGTPVFLDEGECGHLDEMGLPGPTLTVADLAEPNVHVDLEVEPRRYCGMWVPLQQHTPARDLPEGAPEDLVRHSVVIEGTRADGTPFVLAHPEQDEIEVIAAEGTFAVSEAGPRLLLAFDVAVWMRGIDLDQAELNDDGEIRIDATENAHLHEIFDTNHECSLELYLDENENGRLDEDTDPRVGRCAPD